MNNALGYQHAKTPSGFSEQSIHFLGVVPMFIFGNMIEIGVSDGSLALPSLSASDPCRRE
jgi:hypothetical protein